MARRKFSPCFFVRIFVFRAYFLLSVRIFLRTCIFLKKRAHPATNVRITQEAWISRTNKKEAQANSPVLLDKSLFRLHQDRHGAVIDQLDVHHGAKDARFDN